VSVPAVGAASGFAAVQARIAQLDAMLSGAATDTTASGTGSTSSASSFAAQLAAAGLSDDTSSLLGADGLASVTGTGLTSSTSTASTGTPTAQSLIAAAERYIGTPYVWGGESLSEGGLDCSGLVLRAMSDIGVTGVPRTAHEQMSLGTAVPSLAQAQPGDLLVFYGGKHIGIYLGDGKMIDSPHPGGQVSIRDVFRAPTAIRRVLPQATSTTDVAGLTGTTGVTSATDATRLAALGLLQGAAS
jgi:cell wall-associated NlpC family hydrolase